MGWLTGCGQDTTPLSSRALAETTAEEAGEHCEFGGQRIVHGLDRDGDGKLGKSEIEGIVYACNGAPGENGVIGKDGAASLVEVTDESAGDNCASGGKKVQIGLDLDGDGALSASEVTSNFFLCNGEDGAPGIQTLVRSFTEEPGENCAQGGRRMIYGADLDRDGELGEAEIEGESFLCNGVDGLVGLQTLVRVNASEPDEQCPAGGQRVETGVDTDRSGALDEEEVLTTTLLCNGQEGLASLVNISAEEAGANCAEGGHRVESGIDSNRNGVLDEEEIDGTRFVCNGTDGSDGFSTLIRTTDEPAGANCAEGGHRVEMGLDNGDGGGTARNGALEAGEVDSTAYLCNGEDGADGEDGRDGSGGVTVQDGNGAHLGRVLSLGGDMVSSYSFLTDSGYAYSLYYYDLTPVHQTFYYTTNNCTGTAYTYSTIGNSWNGLIGKFAAHLRNQGWYTSVPNTTGTVNYGSYRSDANSTCYANSNSSTLTQVVPTTAQDLGLPATIAPPLTFL